MGKKHSNKSKWHGGSFKTLKPGEVPSSMKAKMEEMKIIDEQEGGSNEKTVDARVKEFVNMQKEYHNTIFNVAVLGAELEVFIKQLKAGDDRAIKWNGMIMPDEVLKPRIGLKNIAYKEGISHLKYLEKALKNKGLSDEEVKKIGMEGRYIKELPGRLNSGREAPKLNQG